MGLGPSIVTSALVLPFVPSRLCTLMPLNTHLFVRSDIQGREHGTWPGAAWTVTKSELVVGQVEITNADVAVIAAHQHERVAGLDWRVAELVRNVDATGVGDMDSRERSTAAGGCSPELRSWRAQPPLMTPERLFHGLACEPLPPAAGVLPCTGSTYQTCLGVADGTAQPL